MTKLLRRCTFKKIIVNKLKCGVLLKGKEEVRKAMPPQYKLVCTSVIVLFVLYYLLSNCVVMFMCFACVTCCCSICVNCEFAAFAKVLSLSYRFLKHQMRKKFHYFQRHMGYVSKEERKNVQLCYPVYRI